MVDGFPNDITPDIPRQPKTVVRANPSFSAEKFEAISIDYDDTLSTDRGKELAKRLLSEGKDLHIVTRRKPDELETVRNTAKDLGIDIRKVHSTGGELKWKTLKELGIKTHYDNSPQEISAIEKNAPEIKAIKFASEDFESTNDYPESASNNACKVLEWRDKYGDEVNGMTQVGWTRANQLCNKENISRETIGRMAAFERHRQNAEVAPEFKDTPWKDAGHVAWLGWGGTTGIEWAKSKVESFGYDVSTIGGYEDPGVKKKKKEKKFQIESEDKRIIVGPAMVPDLKIPRVDPEGNYYEVFFSADTIRMIAEKYMRNKYLDNNDEMHNGEAVKDVYVMESWIKETEEDKSNKYGFQDTPIGTWFVMMRVKNDEIWNKIKSGDLRGFSVSGFFEEVAAFCREEMFLQRLAELLKEY